MLTDNKLLRIKNGVLLLLAVICPIVCRLISIPLPSVMTEWDKTSLYIRNMTGYLRDNYVSLVFFFVFVTSGLTSLLLGNLIHRKFDRNKEASVISLRAGLFFLIAAAFFLTDANTMFVLPGSRELSGYISCASLMLMPQLFIACVKLVYKSPASSWYTSANGLFCRNGSSLFWRQRFSFSVCCRRRRST